MDNQEHRPIHFVWRIVASQHFDHVPFCSMKSKASKAGYMTDAEVEKYRESLQGWSREMFDHMYSAMQQLKRDFEIKRRQEDSCSKDPSEHSNDRPSAIKNEKGESSDINEKQSY